METSAFVEHVSSLSDAELITKLDRLVANERSVCAAVLAHMAEVDARQLYHHDGYPSLYRYAIGRLRLSQAAARHRITAARRRWAMAARLGHVGAVLEVALDALLTKLRKRKFGETHAPRRARRALKPGSRHIPAEVKRKVSERDGRQCTFVGKTGRRCTEVAMLEYHHKQRVPQAHRETDNWRIEANSEQDQLRLRVQSCMRDEGRPFEVSFQKLASNHSKLLR